MVAMPFNTEKKSGSENINCDYVDVSHPELKTVSASAEDFNRYLEKFRPAISWQPRQVFLFSGHMIDAPERASSRFPPEKESIVAQKISEALGQLDAGPDDLALTQGACGGDLLFTEACQQRGVKVHWLQPFREPDFIRRSVVRCGEAWRIRYLNAKGRLAAPIHSAPDELGEAPPNASDGYPYERCNLWLLYTTLAFGAERLRFICLWNGEGGDGPGGTAHMISEVKRKMGQMIWLDTRLL